MSIRKIAQLRSVTEFRQRCDELGIDLPADDLVLSADEGTPMARNLPFGKSLCGNRWCIHPMEGWDANFDGSPSRYTLRRWKNFGRSGAKLIWGGEAAAVRIDGRANPRQTLAVPSNLAGLRTLREVLVEEHEAAGQSSSDLVVGLQLTHSGRFSVDAQGKRQPRLAYHHPLLDRRFDIDPHDVSLVWTDQQLQELKHDYVVAAQLAEEAGYQFVDVKACHGYLLHEFLSGRTRPGEYGGDFAGRTRLLREIIQDIRRTCPGLDIGVRLSIFDRPPYNALGQCMADDDDLPYQHAFGASEADPLQIDLHEPQRLMRELADLGVVAFNLSAGSPYYCPHIQRPAAFPPSDGYAPPEDPLVGVARQIHAARDCKLAHPDLVCVGTGYTYLQEYLPHLAQAVVRNGWIDSVGLGRLVLSYPELPLDTLRGQPWQRKRVCRTFSDCTTAPRNGLVSGCYPLDDYYKRLPEAHILNEAKQRTAARLGANPKQDAPQPNAPAQDID